jgi:IPT/TIG domain
VFLLCAIGIQLKTLANYANQREGKTSRLFGTYIQFIATIVHYPKRQDYVTFEGPLVGKNTRFVNQLNSHRIQRSLFLLLLVAIIYRCVDGILVSPDPDAPVINDISPESGTIGSELTINGLNFNGNPGQDTVFINGEFCEIISSTSTTIVVLFPAGATTGPVLVRSDGKTALGPDFVVETGIPAPRIDSIKPNSGATGTAVEVKGAWVRQYSPAAYRIRKIKKTYPLGAQDNIRPGVFLF